MHEECIFCKIAKGEIPAEKVMDTGEFLAFKDINPVAPTHILIIPKEHIPTLNDLPAEKINLVGSMLAAARDIAKKAGIAESGYRAIVNCNRGAGQEIFHLHMHLIGGRPLTTMG
ncbi:MAG: histidine triad nucleotide-binding protein [bacterium]